MAYLATGSLGGACLHRRGHQLFIQCWRSTLLRQERCSFYFPRFLSVSPTRSTKQNCTTPQGTSSELFTADETFKDDPSILSSGILENMSQSTSGSFQPVDMSSLGLCSNWPQGWIQYILEGMFNHTYLPWWGCIVTLTIVMRVLVFPLALKMRWIAVKLELVGKESCAIHAKIANSKALGNQLDENMAQVEMMKLYKKHRVTPLSMFPILIPQTILFLSFFHGLKGMTSAPVEELKTGGTLWFPDLVVPDPFYVLPLLACVTFLTNVELGGDTTNELARKMKLVFRVGAVCIVPFTASFPSAILVYWVTNSLLSSVQIMLFKYPPVKSFLNIASVTKGGLDL